jgi:hypothetical protein
MMMQSDFLNYDLEQIKTNYIHGSSFRALSHIDVDNRLPLGFQTYGDHDKLPYLKNGKRKAIICTRLDWETNLGNLNDTFRFIMNHADKTKFILITYGSYISPPKEYINNIPENVHKWYAVNSEHEHSKVTGIPLGIAKPIWDNGQISSLVENCTTEKQKLLYINHNVRTDERTDRAGVRRSIYDRFKNESGDWFKIEDITEGECPFYGYNGGKDVLAEYDLSNTDDNAKWQIAQGISERGVRRVEDGESSVTENTRNYHKTLSQYKFTLAPSGMGYDTMRLWEALYMKTIPIVTDCTALRHFEDLPILYSKDFSELTEEYLLEKYEEISNKTWNFDKLFMPFWKKQIETEYGLIQE